MRHLSIDIETYSSVDIKKSGLYKYVQSPDFQIILFAYSLDGAPVQIIDMSDDSGIPSDIVSMLMDSTIIKHAYNATFEWYCISKYLFGHRQHATVSWLPQWQCTMLHGLYCGYPGGLAAIGEAIGLPPDKKKLGIGNSLIKTFCVPCKPSRTNGNRTRTLPIHEPDKWKLFKEYCIQDVVTEMAVENKLSAFPVPESVQKEWELDVKTNLRGVAVDLGLIHGALQCAETVNNSLMAEAVQLTGLDNPKSVSQLKSWLEEEIEEDIESLNKDTVTDLLGRDLDNNKVNRVLEIRQELSKTSVKKYDAMLKTVCEDGRIRGLLQFYGANRTGRWAGRLVQVQNLPRTYLSCLPLARQLVKEGKIDNLQLLFGSLPDTLSQLIRTAFIAAPGHILVDADFSAIEARITAWLANEEWVLNVFRGDGKIYEATAAQMFGVDIALIKKGNPEYALRQKGKLATVALGYGGGVGALIAMGAIKQGLTEEELPDIVRRWRDANRRIKDLWYKVEGSALEAVKTGRPQAINNLVFAIEGNGIDQWFLTITLPSGRKLYYVKPQIAEGQYGDAIRYWGLNQTTKKWELIDTWGGKLVENCVQAIARDILSESLINIDKQGLNTVFHVHDEVVIEAELITESKTVLNVLENIMGQPISWAEGLPLGADGYVSEFFKKD